MTDWMRTEYMFPDHRAVFTLTAKCMYGKRLWEVCQQSEIDPDDLAALLKEVVVSARPELAGCQIYFMRYNPFWHSWEIGVLHDSLPAVHMSAEAPTFQLVEIE